jgi:hypothetical protein
MDEDNIVTFFCSGIDLEIGYLANSLTVRIMRLSKHPKFLNTPKRKGGSRVAQARKAW